MFEFLVFICRHWSHLPSVSCQDLKSNRIGWKGILLSLLDSHVKYKIFRQRHCWRLHFCKTFIHRNHDKQGSCWGPIVRTAWQNLSVKRFPTVTHSVHGFPFWCMAPIEVLVGSGWYSRTWKVKEKPHHSLMCHIEWTALSHELCPKKKSMFNCSVDQTIVVKSSPQIWQNLQQHVHQSPWASLPQLMLEHISTCVVGR